MSDFRDSNEPTSRFREIFFEVFEQLHLTYAKDAEALTLLYQIADEPEMHRRYCEFDAYKFFMARRPVVRPGP